MKKSNLMIIPICFVLALGLGHIGPGNKTGSPKLNKAHAAENAWGGVRGAASLARAANLTVNGIISNLGSVLKFLDSLPIILGDPIFNGQVGEYHYELNRNGAYGPGGVYTGSLEGWKVTAGPTYTKILEFYWDDLADPSAGDGVLFIIRPYGYNQLNFYANELYQVRYKLDPSGNKAMLLSFIGDTGSPDGFWYNDQAITRAGFDDGCLTRGIVRFTDVAASNWYEFAGVAKRECDCLTFDQGGASYYTLAFLAYKNSPYYSTAKFGNHATAAGTDANSFWLCVIDNPLNYGYFSSSGFQRDGVSTDDGTHPDRTDVDGIEFDNSTDNDLDVTRAQLDGFSITLNPADPTP